MPYQERQTRIETNNHFITLNQIPARDYWLGSEYNGTYHDRLQINLSAIEAICRAANLPPLVIATEAWTPPRAHEPEIVGRSAGQALAGQKQALFRRQNEERPIKTFYVEMEPLPEHVDILLNDAPISIGWVVKINSRKIDYDFTQKHPNSNETGREDFLLISLINYYASQ